MNIILLPSQHVKIIIVTYDMFIRYCHLWQHILVTLVDTLPTIEVVIATGYDIQAIPYYLDPALVYCSAVAQKVPLEALSNNA